jgi:hypothetical protein
VGASQGHYFKEPSAACRKIASGGVLARLWHERLLATHELARLAIWLRHNPVRALVALWRSPEVGGSAPLGLCPGGRWNIFGKRPKEADFGSVLI